jgi:hypothetical protein
VTQLSGSILFTAAKHRPCGEYLYVLDVCMTSGCDLLPGAEPLEAGPGGHRGTILRTRSVALEARRLG